MNRVLVLNSDGSIHDTVSWQRAVGMLLSEQVYLVEQRGDEEIRSTSMSMPFPSVVGRMKFVRPRSKVQFNRKHILARDAYTCQYCGCRPEKSSGAPRLEILTIDHVVPRAQAKDGWVTLPWSGERVRVTCWKNVLTACESCNSKKANRTPKQAKMHMMRQPRIPSSVDIAWMALFSYEIPTEWKDYLPKSSAWRGYWDAELSDS